MSVFSDGDELDYLRGERRLARIATVGKDGTPHVVPVGSTHKDDLDTIDIGGYNLEGTKKFRDVARSGRAAVVIDDIASLDPWHVRGVEVRSRADAERPWARHSPRLKSGLRRVVSLTSPGRSYPRRTPEVCRPNLRDS